MAIPLICDIACWIIDKRKKFAEFLTVLSASTFFIFASHGRHISYIYNALWQAFGICTVNNQITTEYANNHVILCVISYLLTPIVTISLCYMVYKLIKYYLPHKIMVLLNGK